MSRREILRTKYGEMVDLINCLAVYNNKATEKRRRLSYDEVIALGGVKICSK